MKPGHTPAHTETWKAGALARTRRPAGPAFDRPSFYTLACQCACAHSQTPTTWPGDSPASWVTALLQPFLNTSPPTGERFAPGRATVCAPGHRKTPPGVPDHASYTHTTTWPVAGCRSGPSLGLPPPRCASARRTLTTCLPPLAPNPTSQHARALRLLVDGDSCPECQHQVLRVVASTAAPISAHRCSLAPWVACTRAPVALAVS